MLCAIKPTISAHRFRVQEPIFSLLNVIIAIALIVLLTLYPGASQAEALTDVSNRVSVEFEPVKGKWKKRKYKATVVVTNTSAADIEAPLRLGITEFKNKRHLLNSADGDNDDGVPFIEIDLPGGVLAAGQSSEPQLIVFEKLSGKAWKRWKKINKPVLAAKDGDVASPGWSDHDFPIKFNYVVEGNFPRYELIISQPDVVPSALKINQGEVSVLVTTTVQLNFVHPVDSIEMRKQAHGGDDCNGDECCDGYECCYDEDCNDDAPVVLYDDGISPDLKANDGIFSALDIIDTDKLESGECLSYIVRGQIEGVTDLAESEETLLCATNLATELVETFADDANIIDLDGASVLGNELLVRLQPGASSTAFEELVRSLRGFIVGTQLEDGIYQVTFDRLFNAEQLSALKAQFEQFDGVLGVDPNYVGEFTSIPDDPEFQNQHGLRLVSADSLGQEVPLYVWDAGATGAGTEVIVIDSGVNERLPDDIEPSGNSNDTDDQLGHGTEMASIIAAPTDNATAVAAMARDAGIRSIRLSKTNRITLSKMLNGFKRAKGYAGRNTVISASFSIKNMLSDGGVCRKIHQIINRGAIVVVSAGNDNSNADTGIVPGNCNSPAFDAFTTSGRVSPTNKNSLIVVGASSCTEGACEQDSRWEESNNVGSNRGGWVDIFAPGVNIRTMTNNGDAVSITGTSPATALVAGAAAILRGCDVGGSLNSLDGGNSLADVFNAMDLGATVAVTGSANRLNLYNALASVNTVPFAVSITNAQVLDGTDTTGGFPVGGITISDDTVCDAHSIAITGGADASSFSIGGADGNQLIIDDGVIDSDTQSSYQVVITASDFYGASRNASITVAVVAP